VAGVARERAIGSVREDRQADVSEVARLTSAAAAGRTTAASSVVTPEPLAGRQWDMRQIGATASGSYARSTGSKKVRVGVIDTGIDGSHPDIAPNFSRRLSRNFVTDRVAIDGACEHRGCVDPVDEDDDGHGTHVASTIGSPVNGLGIAGVAPDVTLVNIRAGQDSGYFFLGPTLEALTYAGDIGVDVVNMSFYTDPWLFNCLDNPADTPAEQEEQRVVRVATQRALNYAMRRNVLPVAAMGNEATDLNAPTTDTSSPDYPTGAAGTRTIDNSCITVPTESRGVVAVSATGPSRRKAYYSNYGTEQTDVAAPGGDLYDTPDNTRSTRAAVLAAYPRSLAVANNQLERDGSPNTDAVVRSCKGTVCAYYQYLQGTSMASPHASGVAALVASRHGRPDRAHGGLKLPTDQARRLLYRTAQPQRCPRPRLFHYTRNLPGGEVSESDARCVGPLRKNGFYGRGIVNAYRAVVR
jgi:subtilisin family serine protease